MTQYEYVFATKTDINEYAKQGYRFVTAYAGELMMEREVTYLDTDKKIRWLP